MAADRAGRLARSRQGRPLVRAFVWSVGASTERQERADRGA
nr:MAG TPA_asm: hypothetical protein [Caudoviricetes sp.]